MFIDGQTDTQTRHWRLQIHNLLGGGNSSINITTYKRCSCLVFQLFRDIQLCFVNCNTSRAMAYTSENRLVIGIPIMKSLYDGL